MKMRSLLVALMLATSATVIVTSFAPTAAAKADCIGQATTNAKNQTKCVGWAYNADKGSCIGVYDERQTDVCDGIDP